MAKVLKALVLGLGLSLACAAALASGASAGELSLWAGGAVKSAITEALVSFEKSSGVKVKADFAPVGTLMKRLAADPAGPDVVILTVEAMAEAIKAGQVQVGSLIEVGRVGVGVAVDEKAPAPDISTAAAVKATLLAAKSIVMVDPNTGTSGKHLAQVFEKLGIADAIRGKTTVLAGGYVVEPVGRGEIEIGLHQITEILPVKGIKLVGPLPDELQKVTIYHAAITTKSRNPGDAATLMVHFLSDNFRASLKTKGFIVQ